MFQFATYYVILGVSLLNILYGNGTIQAGGINYLMG